jgi:hypothetical protein
MNILDKIKNVFSKPGEDEPEFERIVRESRDEYARENRFFYNAAVGTLGVYKNNIAQWPDEKRVKFIIYCIQQAHAFNKGRRSWSGEELEEQRNTMRLGYVDHLFRAKILLRDEDARLLYEAFSRYERWNDAGIHRWPVSGMVLQIERQYKGRENNISNDLRDTLQQIRHKIVVVSDHYYEKDRQKLLERIDGILHRAKDGAEAVKPTHFATGDEFADWANGMIEQQPADEKEHWYRLLALAQKASGAKPSQKFLNESKAIIGELGADKFRQLINEWLVFVTRYKEVLTTHTQVHGGREYSWTSHEFLMLANIDTFKGLVWMCAHFNDNTTLRNLSALAERCYRKIPGHGPAAAAISNACFFVLYKSEGLEGIGQLSRLRLRIKQSTAQGLIERYLNEAAAEQGVSRHEIEDLAVDDFELTDGKREWMFDDYRVELVVTGPGKSDLNWYKPDGAPQKSAPAFAKEKYAARLKEIKDLQKQVDQTSVAQRDRIDRMLRADRKWTMEHFQSLYLDHGLMGCLAKKIIWNFDADGQTQSAILLDGQWIGNDNTPVHPSPGSTVSLWHPATQTVAEIKKWRDFLLKHTILQPLKQAYREVYLLTEAEINTLTYSNRMAAHVLKQHQFNNLAKMRGWKYSLMGAYDDGRSNEAAELLLPEYGLRAEYWVNEMNVDGAMNDAGIWNYVATDQIRFLDAATNVLVRLPEVAPIPFSEVLRDVDLFVGVASVGNDPTWQDTGGVPAYRDYWTNYSFGDLSEVAKNRREILTGLVPRLKIGKVAEVKDKFLVVKGKLRTYKIHIGSTNILMEPNDQYLCIVPDRSQKPVEADNLFLPFEGDTGLSIILSKAMLLADDDKITDRTITSQIKWK